MKNVPSNLISYNKLVGVGGDDDDVGGGAREKERKRECVGEWVVSVIRFTRIILHNIYLSVKFIGILVSFKLYLINI